MRYRGRPRRDGRDTHPVDRVGHSVRRRCCAHRAPAAEAAVIGDVFGLTNLFPSMTGLKMTVWIEPRPAKGDVAVILVNATYGDATRLSSAVVAIDPVPRLITGYLSGNDLAQVLAWIAPNQGTLLAMW